MEKEAEETRKEGGRGKMEGGREGGRKKEL